MVDVFKVKYDYHNLKVLLKARALGMDGKRLLVDAGRVRRSEWRSACRRGTYDQLPTALGQAAEEAGEVLSTTGDPQRSDFTLDRAYFREMLGGRPVLGQPAPHRIRPGDHRQRESALRRADPADEKKRGFPQAGAL